MSIRHYFVLAGVGLGVLAIFLAPISSSTTPKISLVPLGRATNSLGAVWFSLAVTNNTDQQTDLIIAWEQVVRLPNADMHTNRGWADSVSLSPKAGTRLELRPPRTSTPWTLRASYQRSPGTLKVWANAVGFRVGLSQAPFPDWQRESIQIPE